MVVSRCRMHLYSVGFEFISISLVEITVRRQPEPPILDVWFHGEGPSGPTRHCRGKKMMSLVVGSLSKNLRTDFCFTKRPSCR